MRSSILLVEDAADISSLLVEFLSEEAGFTVCAVETLGKARAELAKAPDSFNIVLLDAGLPDGDGRDFCASLRGQGCRTPVMLISGLDFEDDIVRAFEAGADDYLTKPFGLGELLARVNALLQTKNTRHGATVCSLH